MAIEVLKLLDDVFVDGVNHVNNLKIPLPKSLDEGRSSCSCSGLTSNDVDVFLPLLHAFNVLFQADHIFSRFGAVVPEVLAEFLPVAGVFVDAELEILAELLVELLEVLSVLTDLLEEFQTLFSDILLDNLEDFVVLEILSG